MFKLYGRPRARKTCGSHELRIESEWADKSAALESYAKQADDEELLNNARRIKVRAIDRMGEPLDEVPRREAKQARGKVVSLGTLLSRAPKSPAALRFRVVA